VFSFFVAPLYIFEKFMVAPFLFSPFLCVLFALPNFPSRFSAGCLLFPLCRDQQLRRDFRMIRPFLPLFRTAVTLRTSVLFSPLCETWSRLCVLRSGLFCSNLDSGSLYGGPFPFLAVLISKTLPNLVTLFTGHFTAGRASSEV